MDPSKHAPIRINDIRSKYKVIDKVGKGTYGTVFKVLNLQDKKYYAIKKFQNTEAKLQVEGFPITALREISLLKQLNHPNIVNLQEIICSKPNKRNLYRGSTFMVFEYMHHDFAGLFRSKIKFTLPEVKSIMKQLLMGCSFLHQNKVMHRDIKSANILLNDQGIVQLADFGLGRRTRFDNVYTYKVVTLWYRAPQLLLGCKTYNHKVDVWSIGCVFAELLTSEVLFKKQTEYAIIEKIYEVCGDLEQNQYTQDYLRGCVYYNDMQPKKAYKNTLQSLIRKLCPNIDNVSVKFLQGLLQLNPYKRLSCEEALEHQFFKVQPTECEPQQIQKMQVEYHEMFRDRSLKIDRKSRKESVDWSEEQRKKGKEQKRIQQKKDSQQPERQIKAYVKPEQDKTYVEKTYERRIYGSRFDEKKQSYSREEHTSYRVQYRQRKKQSRSPSRSQTSSSSSSSPSRRSRSRNGKRNYDDDNGRSYTKRDSYNQRQKVQIYSGRKDNGFQREKSYSSRERVYGEKERTKEYISSKGYQQRGQTFKKEYYHEQSRFYKEKSYDNRDRKDYGKVQYGERKQIGYRPSQKYPREDYERSYSKTTKQKPLQEVKSYKMDKYEPGEYRQKSDIYRARGDDYRPKHAEYRGSRDNYEQGEYKHRRDTGQKYDNDRYSRAYSRDSKGETTRKQYYPPSQKYQEIKLSYPKSADKQYRDDKEYRGYERQPYDYSRKQTRNRDDDRYKDYPRHKQDSHYKEGSHYKEESKFRDQPRNKDESKFRDQSRNKDYLSKKISIESRQSTEQKKSSPQKKSPQKMSYQKKDIDIEDY